MRDPIQPCGTGHLATCPHPRCQWEAFQLSRAGLSDQLAKHLKNTHPQKDAEQ